MEIEVLQRQQRQVCMVSGEVLLMDCPVCKKPMTVTKTALTYFVTKDGSMSEVRATKPTEMVCEKCGGKVELGYEREQPPFQ